MECHKRVIWKTRRGRPTKDELVNSQSWVPEAGGASLDATGGLDSARSRALGPTGRYRRWVPAWLTRTRPRSPRGAGSSLPNHQQTLADRAKVALC